MGDSHRLIINNTTFRNAIKVGALLKLAVTAVFVTLVATAGCSKRSAAAALRAADQAVESAWPEADRYVPEQVKALAEAALVQAVDGARTARGRADQLMASLGLVTFPPAVPAPPRAASPAAPK